ncbi:hypothetical protein CRENBAI_004329 [Crenichthys baileyi]|uniref:Uncharacterized protein n=1 Tax=Crenichthys baileyi TaxID=28760 RepID=A0AAV9R1E8_9TELE
MTLRVQGGDQKAEEGGTWRTQGEPSQEFGQGPLKPGTHRGAQHPRTHEGAQENMNTRQFHLSSPSGSREQPEGDQVELPCVHVLLPEPAPRCLKPPEPAPRCLRVTR